jgi:hypothetical protein
MLKKFNEYFVQAQFEPIKSFYLKDDLNRDVWDDNDKLDEEIREQLIRIGEDFYEGLELSAEIVDIAFCGSLCNYNWSEYSDVDLHIILKFDDINEDHELVEKMVDYAKKVWNEQHDITIKGFDVEIAVQDEEDLYGSIEGGRMGGVYSLLNDEWIKKPSKEDFTPDEDLIRKKASDIMTTVKELEEDYESDVEYDELMKKLKKVWKKVKDGRQAGLDREGEYSIENLVFKLLRRNGYIQRIMDVRRKAYDKQFK